MVFKDGTIYEVQDERHAAQVDRYIHEAIHDCIHTMYQSGFGATFGDTTFSIAQGVTHDEDLEHDSGGTKTACAMWWRNAALTSMRVLLNITTPWYSSAGAPQYDLAGTITPVPSNRYFCSYVYATNSTQYPIYIVVGQSVHTTIEAARNEALPSILLSTTEWKILYKAIYKESGGSAVYQEATDFRTVTAGPAGTYTPTDHASTINRDAANSHPATAISNTPAGSIAATTVQAAIDELDTEKSATTHTHTGTYEPANANIQTHVTGTGSPHTAAGVGADAAGTAAGAVSAHNSAFDHTKLHDRQHSITSTSDHTSTATAGQMLKADANGLPTDATNTDAQVSAAVTASHAANHAASHVNGTDDIQSATAAQKGVATAAQITKLDGIEAGADVTDATNVAAAGAVMESDYDAQSILAATSDNTPAVLTVAEDRVVGRITGGNVAGLTITQLLDMVAGAARGDILRREASAWNNLAKGASGTVLTMGADDPAWATPSSGAAYASPLSWNMLTRPPDAIGAGTWANSTSSASNAPYNGYLWNTSNANLDNCSVDVRVPAGTYTLRMNVIKTTAMGIMDVDLDGAEVGSLNCYAAVTAFDILSITGLTMNGPHTLRFRVDGKHASATDYNLRLSGIELIRTGD
jgi:hypothetical protein